MKKEFLGNKLRLARTFNGLTLAQLGEIVSSSRQYIQRLETDDETCPSQEMLEALTEALQVKEDFFFDRIEELREDQGHFRRLQTTPLHVRSTVLSYGTIFTLLVRHLEEYVDFPQIKIPNVEVATREDVERAAEQCRKTWGLGLDAPILNMTRTLESAGVVVTTFGGVSEKIDAFSLVRGRPVIVRSIDKESTSRLRFDLAHECGHLVMHTALLTGDPATEAEANQFASAFLLPRVAFIKEFPRTTSIDWRLLFEMKKRWSVSIQAIIRRAYDLGILTAIQYRNANVYISRMQWKRNEPCEPATEAPELIPSAIKYLKEEEGISVKDLACALYVNPETLHALGIRDVPE